MKWYETSLTEQWDAALDLLNKGRAEACAKAFKRIYILCKERERQTRCDVAMTGVPSHYQGIDALLHMEQSKLRVMTDEELSISRVGLMADCGSLPTERSSSRQELARARQALEKILREQRRRMGVYGLNWDYRA